MRKTEGGVFTADLETAEEYFRRIIEMFPTSKYVPYANFGIAYVKMKRKNYAECGTLFETFYQRYRSHQKAPEALYLAIKCYLEFVDTPDRDITYALKVRELSEEFIRNNYTGEMKGEVELIRQKVIEVIAQHHIGVAQFYIRRKIFEAAVERINEVLRDEEMRNTKYGKYAEDLKRKIEEQRLR